jgi:hypothetical protein
MPSQPASTPTIALRSAAEVLKTPAHTPSSEAVAIAPAPARVIERVSIVYWRLLSLLALAPIVFPARALSIALIVHRQFLLRGKLQPVCRNEVRRGSSMFDVE